MSRGFCRLSLRARLVVAIWAMLLPLIAAGSVLTVHGHAGVDRRARRPTR